MVFHEGIEKHIMFGGGGRTADGCASNRCDDMWEFDPLSREWTELNAPAFYIRRGGVAYVPATQEIVEFGGYGWVRSENVFSSSIFSFNYTTKSWTEISSNIIPSVFADMVYNPLDGNVLITPRTMTSTGSAHTYLYDPVNRETVILNLVSYSAPEFDFHSVYQDVNQRFLGMDTSQGRLYSMDATFTEALISTETSTETITSIETSIITNETSTETEISIVTETKTEIQFITGNSTTITDTEFVLNPPSFHRDRNNP